MIVLISISVLISIKDLWVINLKEPEVCLRIAMDYIKKGLTEETVFVSLDGAHIKTKDDVHFDIFRFLKENGIEKVDGILDRWQGEYQISGYIPKINISSMPGIGDVNIILPTGKKLRIECKKGKENKSGQEYPLMREAIGQLMTSFELTDDIIPVVAVPFSEKAYTLASKWSQYTQMKQLGIKFFLVKEDDIMII